MTVGPVICKAKYTLQEHPQGEQRHPLHRSALLGLHLELTHSKLQKTDFYIQIRRRRAVPSHSPVRVCCTGVPCLESNPPVSSTTERQHDPREPRIAMLVIRRRRGTYSLADESGQSRRHTRHLCPRTLIGLFWIYAPVRLLSLYDSAPTIPAGLCR